MSTNHLHSSSRGLPCRTALLTPRGRGAVATISIAGASAAETASHWFRSTAGRPLADAPLRRIVFGRWAPTGEDLVACRLEEDYIEIHCHGGAAAAEAILQTLDNAGCLRSDWQAWAAERSTDRIAAAALSAVANARTQRTAAILLDQYRGALRDTLLQVVADLRDSRAAAAIEQLDELLQYGEIGVRLTTGWRVVLAGAPNVGKSSLINAVVGYQRSIVVDRPGTTRDVVTAQTAIDGWPVELADTAGLRAADNEVEAAGVARARAAAADADLVVLVRDVTKKSDGETQKCSAGGRPLLYVINKCDLVATDNPSLSEGIATSAVRGDGIGALIAAISAAIVPQAPPTGAAVPFSQVQVTAIELAAAAARSGEVSAAAARLKKMLE